MGAPSCMQIAIYIHKVTYIIAQRHAASLTTSSTLYVKLYYNNNIADMTDYSSRENQFSYI